MSQRLAVLIAVLVVFCGAAVGSSAQEVRAAVPDSVEGLQIQIGAILDAATNHSKKNADPKRMDDVVSDLRIPEDASWFVSEFGDDVGAKLAATYKESWDNFRDTLTRSFLETAEWKPKKTSVTVFGSSSPFDQVNMNSIEQSAKSPVKLYEVVVVTQKMGHDVAPGLYVYVDGAFRVMNWATLYQLPHVKRQRIRVAGNVEQPKLVHKVNPVFPADVSKNHVQGMVQLHVVIDVDGNIGQIQYLSGPPILMNAAIDAVKQWHYQPTTLNGDPVEVDTTVSINFVPGG